MQPCQARFNLDCRRNLPSDSAFALVVAMKDQDTVLHTIHGVVPRPPIGHVPASLPAFPVGLLKARRCWRTNPAWRWLPCLASQGRGVPHRSVRQAPIHAAVDQIVMPVHRPTNKLVAIRQTMEIAPSWCAAHRIRAANGYHFRWPNGYIKKTFFFACA
jgi:hypothetical protein